MDSETMNNMKLTKKEALDLNNGLMSVGKLGGAKFAYAVSRNVAKLKTEINALAEAYLKREDYELYDRKRIALAEQHSVLKDGKPRKEMVDGIQQYVLKSEKEFEKELVGLKETHKVAIEDRTKQLKEFGEILKETIEINLYMISPDYIPEGINPEQMTLILVMVKEENEEKVDKPVLN